MIEQIIDRLELLIEENIISCGEENSLMCHDRNFGVIQAIECIKKMEKQPKADWIPCEERLPSERDWYLAVFKEADTDYCLIPVIADYVGTVTNGTTEEGWCIAHCTDTGYPSDEYYKKLKCVVWTNLPQPYKKEGAE